MASSSPAVQLASARRETPLPPGAPFYRRLWHGWQRIAPAFGMPLSRPGATGIYFPAAAWLGGGMLVAAAEEERFSRIKHDFGFPEQAIAFCLAQAGVKPEQLDYVVYYEKPFVKFERILTTSLQTIPR